MIQESQIDTLEALARELSREECVPERLLFSESRARNVTAARHKLFYAARKFGIPCLYIADYYGFQEKTVRYGMQMHAIRNGLPKLISFDAEKHLEQRRIEARERKRQRRLAK